VASIYAAALTVVPGVTVRTSRVITSRARTGAGLGIERPRVVADGRADSGEGRLVLPAVVGAEDQVVAAGQHSVHEALRAAGATAGPAVRAAHDSGCVAAVRERQGATVGVANSMFLSTVAMDTWFLRLGLDRFRSSVAGDAGSGGDRWTTIASAGPSSC
jgi:hypothetical protein